MVKIKPKHNPPTRHPARVLLILKHKKACIIPTCALLLFLYLQFSINYIKEEQGVKIYDVSHLPQQCQEVATKFHKCQQNSPPLVLACHRKWCSTFGHCDPCAGIGDRTQRMLQFAAMAVDKCVRMEFDYVPLGLNVVSDAVYRDPLGYAGEVLHKRSYDVSARNALDTDKLGKERLYSHFFGSTVSSLKQTYDPCLFHTILQPNVNLQREIDTTLSNLGGVEEKKIGIHFRTGDSIAFGMDFTKDKRVSDLKGSLDKMLKCAQNLSEKLYHTTEVTYYLATDNSQVKDLLPKMDNTTVHTLPIRPSSYLKSEGEKDAWLELYLLSQMDGLVMNPVSSDVNYEGSGGIDMTYEGKIYRVSKLVHLAKHVGFFEDDNVMLCPL
mmetsp:Transcript_36669/g.56130  ORF Transcript_36669/g.56130 Transcript_36669/m.56130 type:complete len:382 (-) Transcript_36669:55-1200(-)